MTRHVALAALMYGDAEAMRRFQMRRRRHKDIFTGTLQFIWWGLSEPFRALRYALAADARPAVAAVTGEASAVRDAPEQAPTGAQWPEPLLPSTPQADLQPAPQANFQAAPRAPMAAPAEASPSAQGPARASNDWVRMMLDYENERALSGRTGRGTGAA